MPKPSAGLLVYRRTGGEPEVLLVQPGGPFWAKEDEGAWSIPKGEIDDPSDDPFAVAVREFEEELGAEPPDVSVAIALGELRQPSGKVVAAWAVEGDLDGSRATRSRWSGHHARGGREPSPRSTAPAGSGSRRPAAGCSRARSPSSTGS